MTSRNHAAVGGADTAILEAGGALGYMSPTATSGQNYQNRNW